MTRPVHVAVGVVRNARGEILIAWRDARRHQGGQWEFPGGKVEAGESVQSALARELREEVRLEIGAGRPLLEIRHDYGDKEVLLDVWLVEDFAGTAAGTEGQAVRWVAADQLRHLEFPQANRAIIEALEGLGSAAVAGEK